MGTIISTITKLLPFFHSLLTKGKLEALESGYPDLGFRGLGYTILVWDLGFRATKISQQFAASACSALPSSAHLSQKKASKGEGLLPKLLACLKRPGYLWPCSRKSQNVC